MHDDGREHAWETLGPLSELKDGEPELRKTADGRRLAVVREGDTVHAIDDRCPHQGYPLIQGDVRDGRLTCAFHNWKFELSTGRCVLGGEDVRRYPTRVVAGEVLCDLAIDVEAEASRLRASIGRTLREEQTASALRDALRLSALFPERGPQGLGAGFAELVADGAGRSRYGFEHPLAMTADLISWAERGWVEGSAALAVAIGAVADDCANLPPRPAPAGNPERIQDASRIAADLEAERIDEAELRVQHLLGTFGVTAAAAALLPFAATYNLDYGHGPIYLSKAVELSARFDGATPALFSALTQMLGLATRETALPTWKATRDALHALAGMRFSGGPLEGDARARFEEDVLKGERAAAEATIAALADGRSPVALLRAAARAAAERVTRFDRAWEHRLDSEVSVLGVSHTVTFAEAALALVDEPRGLTDPLGHDAARLALLAATFVGKVRAGDRSDRGGAAVARRGSSAREAIEGRDVGAALAAASDLDAEGRRDLYREVAPFAAFDYAVRPIRTAHSVKMTEALHRLEASDPEPGSTYVRALASFLAPRTPETDFRRAAAVAEKFLEDGRPPTGLY